MLVRALAIVVAIAACSAPAVTTPAAPVEAPRRKPTTKPPAIAWRDGAFHLGGLPAVARDGSAIVYGVVDRDGERGNANLRLVIANRDSRAIGAYVVLAVEDGDAMFGPDEHGDIAPTPELDARIARGNRWLADTHDRLDLVAMQQLPSIIQREGENAAPDDTEITWTGSRLSIRQGAKAILDRPTPTGWFTVITRAACQHRALFASAAIDVARKLALVSIAYAPIEHCDVPADQHHVVSW